MGHGIEEAPDIRVKHQSALRRRQPLTGTSYPFRYLEIGLNLKELATVFLASASRLISSRRMAERILATAANAVDHAVERRVLLVDRIVRIHQVFFRRNLIGARLPVADRRIRQQLLARVRR